MCDVLLVNPPASEKSLGKAYFRMREILPPINLGYIAAYLEKSHSVMIFDFQVDELEQYLRCLVNEDPRYVGFSVHTSNVVTALKLAMITKRTLPKSEIVFGGPHPSAMPKDVLSNQFVDFVIVGDGEFPLAALVNGSPLESIPGLGYRIGDFIKVNPPVYIDVNSIPSPAYHLLKMHEYKDGLVYSARRPSYPIFTAYGCPYHCKFCQKITRYRMRKLFKVFEEISLLINAYGMKDFLIMDGTFTIPKKRVLEFCNRLKGDYDLTWSCMARVENLDAEIVRHMAAANCKSVGLGIESASEKLRKNIGKNVSTDKIYKAIRLLHEFGIESRAFFVLGFPDERLDEALETIRLAKDLNADYTQFTVFTPFPGTEFYELLKRAGRIDEDWSKFTTFNISFRHRYMSTEDLGKLLRNAYREVYFSPRYALGRLRAIIENPRRLSNYIRGLYAALSFIREG